MVDSMSTQLDPLYMYVLPEKLKAMCCGRLATGDVIHQDVYDRVRDGQGHGTIPHKNYYAYCWFQYGEWHAEVWRKGFQVGTWSDPMLTVVIRGLTDQYGSL
jgi:hypothetical protein